MNKSDRRYLKFIRSIKNLGEQKAKLEKLFMDDLIKSHKEQIEMASLK